MGLDVDGARFMLYCKTMGVDFAQTATIGRQGLHLGRRDLATLFVSFDYDVEREEIDSIFDHCGGYAERFMNCLGAEEVHSFDNSDYEGATYVHDMNQAMPNKFKNQYSVVLDGGSLEHVFNFPVAIKNCMDMVSVGGHYLGITPANNFLGHGFYQFSPELYFTVFSHENGFEMTSMIAFEDKANAGWYRVKSPRAVGGRVTLTNSVPVYLLVMAKKVAEVPVFQSSPQQSDYVPMWGAQEGGPRPQGRAAFLDLAKKRVPAPGKRLARRALRVARSGFSPRFFSPMDPTKGRDLQES